MFFVTFHRICCCCCCFPLLLFLLLLRRNNGTTGSLSHSTGCEELGVGCDGHKELGVKRLHFSQNVLQCGDNSMRIQHNTKKQRRQKASIQAPTRGLQSTVELRNSMECTGGTMKQPAIETFSALWRPTRYLFLLPYPILCLWVSSNPIQHHHPPTLTHAPSWQILKKLKPAVCLFEWVQEIAPPTQTNQPPPPPTHAFHTPISFLQP